MAWLDQVLDNHYKGLSQSKCFDDLTLDEYIRLLLHKDGWERYRPVFNLEREAIRSLLDKVRETRNALAHFRGDITTAQRKQLRFAAEWLAQYAERIKVVFAPSTMPEMLSPPDRQPVRTTPGQFGARVSNLHKILEKGHYDLKLPPEDMRRITVWIDCNSNFFGAYHDIERQLRGEMVMPPLE